jgi:hypothetical protein
MGERSYRVYFLTPDGQVDGPPTILPDCRDDKSALQQTEQFIDGRDLELWDGARLVARLPRVTR